MTNDQHQTLRDLIMNALLTADEMGAASVAIWLDAALVELTGQGIPPASAAALVGLQS
ncbi:hypothetical protein [Sphingomonas pseudosanguinis]|uniref:Uncharacterized protein n=1 Tax=Sphingomonas pseudosanguinis TaxID=413712 RepID=A0A7W6A9E8_9SPHN|nr:hypothetical protein [Sphingomonas pseudosanguinis]MBB3878480.1 hypothetical protein [Sphingomonas pseudosanguinis]MBN3536265.1 hypothetical protein [Sphingomonas pseudosanguinis]